LKYLLEQDDK